MTNFKANLLLPTLVPPRSFPLFFPQRWKCYSALWVIHSENQMCVFVGLCMCERERERGERAGREKKEEEEEEEEKEEEELGGEGGGQDLICQEDYRLSYQKLLV